MQQVIGQRKCQEQLFRILTLLTLLWAIAGCDGSSNGTSDTDLTASFEESDTDLTASFGADSWSPKIIWRLPNEMYATGIHATLLPDGRVLLIGAQRPTEDGQSNPAQTTESSRAAFILTPTPLSQASAAENLVADIEQPVEMKKTVVGETIVNDNLFCTGHSLTRDGRFFSAGGTRTIIDTVTQQASAVGLAYATLFDVSTDTWIRLPQEMISTANLPTPGRWYPAITHLPDDRMLVTGGFDRVSPAASINLSVEAFDLASGVWTELSSFSETPVEIFNSDYTHPVVLPTPIGDSDILMFGQAGIPVLMTSSGPPNWLIQEAPRPGTQPGQNPNRGASTALLPIRVIDGEWGYTNGSVLIAGGDYRTEHQRSVDVYDPVANAWRPRILMTSPRHHPTTVLLPDGQILVAAGHDMGADPALRRALYIDPANDFTATLGVDLSDEIRGYHHVALLLPDGRVLIGGGQDTITGDKPEKSSFRYLYPPYLFQPRPEITDAPDTLTFSQAFTFTTSGSAPAEVVLMALGSITHSFDFNQRYIQLNLIETTPSGEEHVCTVTAPSTAQIAPPGIYMLFVVDADRVPSEAVFVRLN